MKQITFVICLMCGGGAERVISVLSNELSEIGYGITIVTTSGDVLEYDLAAQVKYDPVVVKCKLPIIKQFLRLFFVYKNIKNSNPDIVVSFMATPSIYAGVVKCILNYKLIVSERMDPYQDPKGWLLKKIRDSAYKRADGWVFQTEDARQYFSGKIRQQGVIINNPVKRDLPEPFFGKKRNVIVSVARLEPQKNISMLLEAFAYFSKINPNYELHIYGKGKEEKMLKHKAEKLEIDNKVIFKGFVKDVHQEIRDCKLFAMSSDYEGVSNAMLEALELGLPVVSTDHPIGGARMFIKNGINGRLVKVGDAKEMGQAFAELLSDDAVLEEYARNASLLRYTLSTDAVIKKWIEYIEKV